MTPATVVALITVLLSSSVIAAFIASNSAKRALTAQMPKLQAETGLVKAQENSENIEVLRGLITTLREEVARGRETAAAAEATANKARERARLAEERLDAIESELQDAHEQNDVLSAELAESREQSRLLRLQLEAVQAELRAAREELRAAKDQLGAALRREEILLEHARRVDEWWSVHGNGDGPPPRLINATESSDMPEES